MGLENRVLANQGAGSDYLPMNLPERTGVRQRNSEENTRLACAGVGVVSVSAKGAAQYQPRETPHCH